MRSVGMMVLWIVGSTGCGLAVRPLDGSIVDDRPIAVLDAVDAIESVDAIDRDDVEVLDAQPLVDVRRERIDVLTMRWDAARRDPSVDVTLPDGAECILGTSFSNFCIRLYDLREGDWGAGFACCNGRCESGSCTVRSPEGITMCGHRPCDLRAGQICCPGAGCVPRDRNLCPG
jgi:hypothetical protein